MCTASEVLILRTEAVASQITLPWWRVMSEPSGWHAHTREYFRRCRDCGVADICDVQGATAAAGTYGLNDEAVETCSIAIMKTCDGQAVSDA